MNTYLNGCSNKHYVQVFKHYFEVLEEESLRDNFVVVVSGLLNVLVLDLYPST